MVALRAVIASSLLAACVSGHGCASPPIEADDPLLGSWQEFDVDGAPAAGIIRFDVDGTFEHHAPTFTSTGTWSRIDAQTIRRLRDGTTKAFDSLVVLEEPRVLLGAQPAVNGGWSWSGEGSCDQHGGTVTLTWSFHINADGTISGVDATCNGSPGGGGGSICFGSWVSRPFGLVVNRHCQSGLDTYLKLGDAVSAEGYQRISPN